ncbi:MAG: hypothetical protein MZW92_17315 [Comamonadaceae bacterium]|nr:hypothetical protein [Comamonadaceae bacterium]
MTGTAGHELQAYPGSPRPADTRRLPTLPGMQALHTRDDLAAAPASLVSPRVGPWHGADRAWPGRTRRPLRARWPQR